MSKARLPSAPGPMRAMPIAMVRWREIVMLRLVAIAGTLVLILPSAADARPRNWCGSYLSKYLGLHNSRLARAREWAHVGHNAGGPGIGVVVVWPHHVGIITGRVPDGE